MPRLDLSEADAAAAMSKLRLLLLQPWPLLEPAAAAAVAVDEQRACIF